MRGGRWPIGGRTALVLLAALTVGALVAGASLGPAGAGARAAVRSPATTRAVEYLERAQNGDGGLGEAPHRPSAQLFAGWAALGLASAGVDVATLRRSAHATTLLGYVRRGAGAPDTGSLERTILVLRAAGAPAGSLVAALERRVSRAGSVAGTVNLTAFAVLAMRAAGMRQDAGVVARCDRWLIGRSDRDGGYGFAGPGSGSDSDDTGAVLEALGRVSLPGAVRARRRAVAFLRRDQDRDGGFPAAGAATSNAQSTAWVVQGLLADGTAPASLHRDGHTPVAYLDALVAPDGAVRYARGETQTPVWVTGEALMALTGTPLPVVGRPAAASAPARARSVPRSTTSPGSTTTTPSGSGSASASRGSAPAPPARRRSPARRRAASRHHPGRAAGRSGAATALARGLVRMQASVGALPRRITTAVSLAG